MRKIFATAALLHCLIIMGGVVFFLLPSTVSAASIRFKPEVGMGSAFKACTPQSPADCGVDIDPTSIGNYINEVYNYGIGAIGILSVVAMMIGGAMRIASGGNPSTVQSSNQVITGALTGLVIALCSYSILNFINPDLIKISLIKPTVPTVIPDTTVGSAGTASAVTGDLQDAGIGVKSGVNLNGLQAKTVSEILAFKGEVPAGTDVFVTSAVEGVHTPGTYSHANGYKFDLRSDPSLSKFIESNYGYKGIRSDGAQMYQSSRGTCYAKEANHWDVTTEACPAQMPSGS